MQFSIYLINKRVKHKHIINHLFKFGILLYTLLITIFHVFISMRFEIFYIYIYIIFFKKIFTILHLYICTNVKYIYTNLILLFFYNSIIRDNGFESQTSSLKIHGVHWTANSWLYRSNIELSKYANYSIRHQIIIYLLLNIKSWFTSKILCRICFYICKIRLMNLTFLLVHKLKHYFVLLTLII